MTSPCPPGSAPIPTRPIAPRKRPSAQRVLEILRWNAAHPDAAARITALMQAGSVAVALACGPGIPAPAVVAGAPMRTEGWVWPAAPRYYAPGGDSVFDRLVGGALLTSPEGSSGFNDLGRLPNSGSPGPGFAVSGIGGGYIGGVDLVQRQRPVLELVGYLLEQTPGVEEERTPIAGIVPPDQVDYIPQPDIGTPGETPPGVELPPTTGEQPPGPVPAPEPWSLALYGAACVALGLVRMWWERR
jgi:hypothetical protein